MKREVIGLALICLGLILGAWLGIRVMLIGGIIQLVEGIKAQPIVASGIAFGVTRILLSSAVGWGTWMFSIFIAQVFFLD